VWLNPALANRDDVLAADLPAVGTMTARAAARMFAALIGLVDGVRLISPERTRLASTVAVSGPDWMLGVEVPFGLGYSVIDGYFGSSGTGGSLAYADPARGLALAATKTVMTAAPGDPLEELWALIRAEV
jgi:CubicO group peptidase (beta-lactamase class C family)